jgi:uncharacterized protein YuzB (UPF0349 family)
MKPIQTSKLSLLALASLMPCVMQAAQINVTATQTVTTTAFGTNVKAITANTTWTKDNVYILRDKVFVTNGATLTIEPGTKIYSTLDTNLAGTNDDEFGSIVITRGAKINAIGTAEEPIIMTTSDELEAETQTDIDGDLLIADAPTVTTAGRWGGLVILGNAPIANYSLTTNINEDRIEGFQPAASADLDNDTRADVIEYGGTVSADNSGTISYVSIRHGGYVYSGSSEINGLTLGGVGSGTTIDHVEVYANADDGIEFFGGTVNTSHIVLAFNQDDSFDIDQGYSGTNQFWFAIQAPKTESNASGHDNGGEWDGVTGTVADNVTNSTPIIWNATFIGSGTTADLGNDKGNNAIFLDDRFKGKVYNSVFDDYKEDLIESTNDGVGTGAEFANNTIGRFGGGTPGSNLTYLNTTTFAANTFFDGTGAPINGNSNGGVDPVYTAYSRNASLDLVTIDPRPGSGSPLLTANGATLKAGAPVATTYRGAFGSVNWAAGWTKMDQASYFTNLVEVVATQTVTTTAFGTNVKAITANTTWTKDKAYILRDKVFVTNGATLTIEPGTKIYSTLDTNLAGTNDDEFGSIVITRGAKINAIGTAAEPIVMTTIDELEAETLRDLDNDGLVSEAPTSTTAGRWGGLVILGNAPIANYSLTTNINEDRIEGFQPAASADLDNDTRADVIEYGGTVSADNSGTVRYVSIRHGGYVYSGSSEINGLTLGGVGSGTTIDHVEVYANADDGIEFFGGTVNTSHIVLAFNQDDSFDIDQGYSGTNQFWFAVQAPKTESASSGHDNGGEWDGVTGTIADNTANSTPIIWNATFIGSGTTADLGNDKGNNAIFLDDRFKGKVYNSVFDDYKEDLIESTNDGVGTGAEFAFNTIGRFGGGAYDGSNASNLTYLNTSTFAANTFFNTSGSPINGNSNGGVDPKLTAYSRDELLELVEIDPRPAANSPLWVPSNLLKTGAPVATTYRGAFGSENWASGWTKLSLSGVLTGASAGSSMADADGDGISDAVESTNSGLGFNSAVSDANTVLGTLKTTAQFNTNFTAGQTSVTSNPSAFSLYTAASILDVRSVGQVVVAAPAGPGNVTLTLPVEKSTGLTTWAPAGNLTLSMPKTENKEFYRITIPE